MPQGGGRKVGRPLSRWRDDLDLFASSIVGMTSGTEGRQISGPFCCPRVRWWAAWSCLRATLGLGECTRFPGWRNPSECRPAFCTQALLGEVSNIKLGAPRCSAFRTNFVILAKAAGVAPARCRFPARPRLISGADVGFWDSVHFGLPWAVRRHSAHGGKC